MTIRKARPKQVWKTPTAADHNAIAAAADMYRRGPDAAPERQQPVATDVIMVRNNSGSDKRRGDVLAVTKTKLLSAIERERPWITASGLNAANRNYILCVLLDPLPAGKIGPAQISGQSVAYVNVQAIWHRRAFPFGGSVVQSGLFGPMELLNSPAETGEQMCHVRIGHADNRTVIAQTGQDGLPKARRRRGCLTLGGGTVNLCNPTSTAGKYCASSLSVTAYNVECEEVEPGTFVTLEPGDDWLPLATPLPCESSSESSSFSSSSSGSSSEPSSSGSSSSGSSSSEESSSQPSSSKRSSSEPSSSEPSSSEPSESQPSESQPSSSVPPSSDSGSIVLCSHECTWAWVSGEWVSSTQGCEPECPICSGKPTSPGNYEGEFVIRSCAQ